MVNNGINLNGDLYKLAGQEKVGIQVDEKLNYDQENKKFINMLELQKLFVKYGEKINQLKDDINNFDVIGKRQAITVRTTQLPSISNVEFFDKESKSIIMLRREVLRKYKIKLWRDANLSYAMLDEAFAPARRYFENKEGNIVDAKKALVDANEIYKKLKQNFEDFKRNLDICEKILDSKLDENELIKLKNLNGLNG